MPKKQRPVETWKSEPEAHDYPASRPLSLICPASEVEALVAKFERAETIHRKAKDLLRASGLSLLPADDPEVTKDRKKVAAGERLSPVLLVRGSAVAGKPLIVADGYHRICASYYLNEDADIPCRLVDPS